jgi:hypothetical protein
MTRAAAAPLLNELRGELLVMPREEVVTDHLAMMEFEQQVLATPRLVRRTRSSLVRPRRTAFVVTCVCTTVVSCGLSAAGALPQPLQKITDSIARTLGVPQPHKLPPAPHVSGGALPVLPAPAVQPGATPATPAQHTAPGAVTGGSKPGAAHVLPAIVPKPGQKVSSPPPPFVPPRPTTPGKRITPKPHKPPKHNSDNTPPGFPSNWRNRAISAAGAQLQACSQAQALAAVGCPQVATAAGDAALVESVHWTLLNDPLSGAVAVAQTKFGNPANHTAPVTKVTVYERFQMDATYAETGDTHSYVAYSGGIAEATMTWNGSTFENVTFSPGSAAGHLLPGVIVPPLERPASATDAAVLGAVGAGFTSCPAVTTLPNCAAGVTTPWTVVGDPIQGAVVTFDSRQGDFTVTGSYAMTGTDNLGNPVTAGGHYTATLFFDGGQLHLLSISTGP